MIVTCAPGTHYIAAKNPHQPARCVYCGQPPPEPKPLRIPICSRCEDTRVQAFVWVGPGPTLADWRPVPCIECAGTP